MTCYPDHFYVKLRLLLTTFPSFALLSLTLSLSVLLSDCIAEWCHESRSGHPTGHAQHPHTAPWGEVMTDKLRCSSIEYMLGMNLSRTDL
jgi:hypothetical protein